MPIFANSYKENNNNNSIEFKSSLWLHLRRSAYSLWPSLFDNPDNSDNPFAPNHYNDRDKEANIKTSPPEEESIELHSLWLVEVYPPSYIDGLINAFKKLGWEQETFGLYENLEQWIRNSRLESTCGSFIDLGVLGSNNDNKYGRKRKVTLPNGVDYAYAQMHNITSSLTCIAVNFVFKNEVSLRYDTSLRQPRITFKQKIKNGYTIKYPMFQKRDSIKIIRNDLRDQCLNWFNLNLPGLFAAGMPKGCFPSCELLTLNEQIPFPTLHTGQPEYLYLLGIESDSIAWVSEDLQGFYLGQSLFQDYHEQYHFILAAKCSDIPSKELESYGGSNKFGYTNYVNSKIVGLLNRIAIGAMLHRYENNLNYLRDYMPINAITIKGVLKTLAFIRKTFKESVDLIVVLSDLIDFCKSKNQYEREVVCFKRVNVKYAKENMLSEYLRGMTSDRAAHLLRMDAEVRDLLSQYGSVQNNVVNLKLQRQVKWLTVVILLLAVATIVIGVIPLIRG